MRIHFFVCSSFTFFLSWLLLHIANLVVGPQCLKIVSSMDKVQGCNKLLRELRGGRVVSCWDRGAVTENLVLLTWSTASCNWVRLSPIVKARAAEGGLAIKCR